MKKVHILAVIFAILVALAIFLVPRVVVQIDGMDDVRSSTVTIGSAIFLVDVADDSEARARGLSGREALARDEGLLFVFETPQKHLFWMKEMLFSIDIIWIGEDMKVRYVKENATPESFPEIFVPDSTALYALEVSEGVVAEKKIKVGDNVVFGFENGKE